MVLILMVLIWFMMIVDAYLWSSIAKAMANWMSIPRKVKVAMGIGTPKFLRSHRCFLWVNFPSHRVIEGLVIVAGLIRVTSILLPCRTLIFIVASVIRAECKSKNTAPSNNHNLGYQWSPILIRIHWYSLIKAEFMLSSAFVDRKYSRGRLQKAKTPLLG